MMSSNQPKKRHRGEGTEPEKLKYLFISLSYPMSNWQAQTVLSGRNIGKVRELTDQTDRNKQWERMKYSRNRCEAFQVNPSNQHFKDWLRDTAPRKLVLKRLRKYN